MDCSASNSFREVFVLFTLVVPRLDECYFIINRVNFSAGRRTSRRETAATWNAFKSNIRAEHASTQSCRFATKHSTLLYFDFASQSSYIYACPRANCPFVLARSFARARVISRTRDRKEVSPLSFIFLSLLAGVNWEGGLVTSSRKSAGRMAKRKISARFF